MKVTLSIIKADVGSIGGHTKPSQKMLEAVSGMVRAAQKSSLIIDGMISFTGDDIALIMSHTKGMGNSEIHQFAWQCFLEATRLASEAGLYGAGQDLLVDAPTGTVRGAGPAVAELEFELLPEYRRAEAFLILAADKCGPGAYNYPLFTAFCDPMHNSGLFLNPKIHRGFIVTVIDMDYDGKDGDRIIQLEIPERIWDLAILLQDPNRYAIEFIHSKFNNQEMVASVSATRLHNIAGKYTGKDDPVALVRTQGIFPAPEEMIEPFTLGHFVTGGARGSHIMPLMPVAINTPVTGPYCLPLVSGLACSMDKAGHFTEECVDIFGNVVWDATRLKIQAKADEWRRQGFFGPTMAEKAELSYTGIEETRQKLTEEFITRSHVSAPGGQTEV